MYYSTLLVRPIPSHLKMAGYGTYTLIVLEQAVNHFQPSSVLHHFNLQWNAAHLEIILDEQSHLFRVIQSQFSLIKNQLIKNC